MQMVMWSLQNTRNSINSFRGIMQILLAQRMILPSNTKKGIVKKHSPKSWQLPIYPRFVKKNRQRLPRLSVASMPPYSFAQYASLPEELDQLKVFIQKQGNEYVFTQHPNLGVQQAELHPYTGKLYILQNGRSLSVTSEFAAVVRDNKRGI